MEELVVTASHREQSLLDIPGSIQLLSFDDLAASPALNGAEDVTRYLNGVQAAVANGSQVAFQIRGIGAVDHQALTPGAAAVYSDGVFLATNVQTSGLLYDIDRVEVLKGPQGTLYGRNASSGAIHFLSRQPGAEQKSYLEASVGSFDRRNVSGALGGSLREGTHFRIAGRALRRGPALDVVQTSETFPQGPALAAGRLDEFGLRLSLKTQAPADSVLLLRAHYEEDNGINGSPRNAALELQDFELSVAGDGLQDTANRFFGVSAEWSGTAAGWEMTSITALEGYRQRYGFDFDGSPAPFDNPNLNANLSYDRRYRQLSQELRIQRETQWGRTLLGLSLSYDDFEQSYSIWCGELDTATGLGSCPYVGAPGRVGSQPASDSAATSLVTDIEQTRDMGALFSRSEIDLSEALSLTLGLRLTHENIEGRGSGRHLFRDGTVALNNRGDAGPAVGANVINDSTLSGDLALQHRSALGTTYLSLARGFKSGGFNGEVANNALHYSDEGLFDAETVTAVELGIKSEPRDALSWDAAVFYQYYDAPQARIFVDFELPDGSRIVSNSLSNLDRARSMGVEASLRWQPNTRLRIEAGMTLLDTEIDQQSDLGGNAALFDGNALPFASEQSATVSLSYALELGAGVQGDLRIGAKYRSEFFLDAEGLEDRKQPGYTTLSADFVVRPPIPGLELSVFGRNLLDEDFAVSGYGFIGYNTFRSEPASYGLSARYSF